MAQVTAPGRREEEGYHGVVLAKAGTQAELWIPAAAGRQLYREENNDKSKPKTSPRRTAQRVAYRERSRVAVSYQPSAVSISAKSFKLLIASRSELGTQHSELGTDGCLRPLVAYRG